MVFPLFVGVFQKPEGLKSKSPAICRAQTADKPVDFRRVCFLSFCFVAIVRVYGFVFCGLACVTRGL
ncbi:hypothetical protein J0X15_19070, partial [Roseibium sp. CAU 1637]